MRTHTYTYLLTTCETWPILNNVAYAWAIDLVIPFISPLAVDDQNDLYTNVHIIF